MSAYLVPADREVVAAEYLQVLCSLAGEIERAVNSIAADRLPDLEESLTNQQTLSDRLSILTDTLSMFVGQDSYGSRLVGQGPLQSEIIAASKTLQMLNQRYAALLEHSRRSTSLMVSLLSSFQGYLQEDTGSRLKHQTWSCQV